MSRRTGEVRPTSTALSLQITSSNRLAGMLLVPLKSSRSMLAGEARRHEQWSFFAGDARFSIQSRARFLCGRCAAIARTGREHKHASVCIRSTRSRFSGGQDERDSAISADFAGLHII
jgi:hypothetical protein